MMCKRRKCLDRDDIYELVMEVIMGAVQDAIDQIVTQLGKAKDEILGEIANLEAQVAAGEVPNLDALKAAAQGLDDVVPDPVVEPPVESPVV